MKKGRKKFIIIGGIILVFLFGALITVVKNKLVSSEYEQLSAVDRKMLAEYDQLYGEMKTKELWDGFHLEEKPILAVSKDSFDTYLIDPQISHGHLLSQKITMPEAFQLQSVYRIAPVAPQVLKIRLDVASNFNTLGQIYPVFGNDVYFMKYSDQESFEKPNASLHFTPFLAHEAFHYYMQNEWKILERPENGLTDRDITLLKEQYQLLDDINAELQSQKSHEKLISCAKQYIDVVSKRIESNREYVLSELSHETAEGTAQYLTIKASKLVGYDYGIMYFDNVKNVPMSDVFDQIDAGNISLDYLYNQMPYQIGASLCFLFDELDIPDWQQKLNSQTLEQPINLYDILKDYLLG